MLKNREEKTDLTFLTVQFTPLAFIMHEIYKFGIYKIIQILNKK